MRKSRPLVLVALAFALVWGCSDDDGAPSDAGLPDADAPDVALDAPALDMADAASPDATLDASPDAADASDAAEDSGVVGSAGCASGAGLPEGRATIRVGERDREYVLRLPEGYTRERTWPLIFALHGNGGNTDYWDGESGSRNIRAAVAEDAVLVVALAIDNQWRDYDMDASTYPERMEEELAYFDAILEETGDALCLDEQAIFSMGFSGGGSFSGVLGCRRDYIRAIAVGGSVIYFDPEDCVSTPAAWITIGTEELAAGRERFRDFFRDAAGCAPESTPTSPDEGECIAYDGCDPATPVEYCQHPGGHRWPDYGIDATWAFFQRFIE